VTAATKPPIVVTEIRERRAESYRAVLLTGDVLSHAQALSHARWILDRAADGILPFGCAVAFEEETPHGFMSRRCWISLSGHGHLLYPADWDTHEARNAPEDASYHVSVLCRHCLAAYPLASSPDGRCPACGGAGSWDSPRWMTP
jgi:hypothetical protein